MRRLVIIGGVHPTAVGQSLFAAARQCTDYETTFINADTAHGGPRLWQALLWRIAQRRPARLGSFNTEVLRVCAETRAEWVICAGNLALTRETVESLRALGARIALYSTDDPWNPAHRSDRFLRALPSYDVIFTTRRSNLQDFRNLGVRRVEHLPFGYDERYFHPVDTAQMVSPPSCDLFFAGGGDEDRVPLVKAVLDAGLHFDLYGGIWQRWPATRPAYRGYAQPADLAQMIAGARVCLCLVRRANRDGTSMRTFELPATGACMMVEDTLEHRELFGEDDEAVVYFQNPADLVTRLSELLQDDARRSRLKSRSHQLIITGKHRYADRLQTMLLALAAP